MRYVLIALCILIATCDREAAEPATENADTESTTNAADLSEALYQENCGSCHNGGVYKAPHRMFLGMMAPDAILASMDGIMAEQASTFAAEKNTFTHDGVLFPECLQ